MPPCDCCRKASSCFPQGEAEADQGEVGQLQGLLTLTHCHPILLELLGQRSQCIQDVQGEVDELQRFEALQQTDDQPRPAHHLCTGCGCLGCVLKVCKQGAISCNQSFQGSPEVREPPGALKVDGAVDILPQGFGNLLQLSQGLGEKTCSIS